MIEYFEYTHGRLLLRYEGVSLDILSGNGLPTVKKLITDKIFKLILLKVSHTSIKDDDRVIIINLTLEQAADFFDRNINSRTKKSQFRKELYKALESIEKTKLSAQEKGLRGKELQISSIPMMYYKTVKRGKGEEIIEIKILPEIFNYLRETGIMSINKRIFTINNLSSYNFHNEYNRYYNITANHMPRPNSSLCQWEIIKLTTALRWADLPTLEKVQSSNRNFSKRCTEPIRAILDDPKGIIGFENWYWSKAKGERLTDDELSQMDCYKNLEEIYIRIIAVKEEEEFKNIIFPVVGRKLEHQEKRRRKEQALRKKGERALVNQKKQKDD